MRRQRWRQRLFLILVLALCISLCLADDTDDDPGFEQNPILQKQPSFARSLLVQVLVDGIVVALTAVLFFHLVFTGQYHWPLAATNYALQLAGVVCLFTSCIATIGVVLRQAFLDSQAWPYMFTYLNIPVPPNPRNVTVAANSTDPEQLVWSTAELAGWYIMDASTSAFVQITHIQFLTLLYPSQLEARLILFLLGPLAIVSAAMQLLPIHQSQTVLDYADTVRNTCNAALSLLFTAAVCLWGLLVNRAGAWRTDGGTAAFGAGATALTLGSTVLNFVYIHTRDTYPWLRHLIWVVVLWQSFLGWWWWVGSGCGVGEVEELIRREARRDRRRKARAARREAQKEKAQALWRNASESLGFTRRSSSGSNAGEQIELANMPSSAAHSHPHPHPQERSGGSVAGSDNATTTGSETTSSSGAGSGVLARLRTSPPLLALSQFYHLLRRAHLAAVHSQTIDRVRRRRAVYANETGVTLPPGGSASLGPGTVLGAGVGVAADTVVDPGVVGWGLGSFGLRERERRALAQGDVGDMEDLVQHGTAEDGDEIESVHVSGAEPTRATTAVAAPGTVAAAITQRNRPLQPQPPRERPSSIWWWGPLRRWRLQDSTAY